MLRNVALLGCLLLTGCGLLPEVSHQPTLHNPFPQLTKIAVIPFFNQSHEPTLDGRRVAEAYASELQQVPGFEVIPVGVAEKATLAYGMKYGVGAGSVDARRLAQLLDVDAVVIGAVTDYSSYYPPRLTMAVSWYAANPNFHPIPAGYGLPWGTPREKEIPEPVVFEAQLAQAKAQLKTQTPPYEKMVVEPPPETLNPPAGAKPLEPSAAPPTGVRPLKATGVADSEVRPTNHQATASPLPSCGSEEPVLKHIQEYNGHDAHVTTALENYYYFRNDARPDGWEGYLRRSDDYIRFCCHMHIWEMLGARGGAGESRVVWRWPGIR